MSRIGLLFSFLLLSPALPAQDVQQVFGEGMASYRAGDFEAAIQNFRQVVSLAPDQLVALELLNDSQDALLELMVAGGEFETFALEIIEAASEAGREAIRDGDAAIEAASGCFSDSYGDRARAIFQLGARFGPFAATPLVAELASPDEGRRLGANYALSRLGSEVVEPLLAASHSTNVEVRLGCLLVFAQLEDPRTGARIADLAANDDDGSVRAMAAKLVGGRASDLLFAQGLAYASNGAAGLSLAENHGVLWDVSGATLSFHEVPYSLVPLELAKQCFLRSSELGNHHAGVELAHAYASEIAILAGLVANGDDSFEEALHAQKAAALTLGGSVLDGALRKAVAIGGNAVAIELIALLDGPGKVPSAGLNAALASGSPGVRTAAAIAKAGMGAHDRVVAAALAQAMSLDAARVVHIIDPVEARASTLASNLEDAGVTVTRASSGADGLVNMHLGTAADAVVVADPLSDLYAHRVVSEIQRDLRNVDTAIFVLGNDSTADIDGAGIFQKARHVAIPGIKGLILINFIGVILAQMKGGSEFVLATKAGHVSTGLSGTPWTGQTVRENVDRSLKLLKTDYVDLVQLHAFDVESPLPDDVVEALLEAGYTDLFWAHAPATPAKRHRIVEANRRGRVIVGLDSIHLVRALSDQATAAGITVPVRVEIDTGLRRTGVTAEQALEVARAVATEPEVLLMDEPCSALDPIATAQVEELIDELRTNYSVVIVTHSMQQAARVSQKTAFFHLGNLVEYGETSQIFTNPVDSRTESYITGRIG